VRGMADAIPAYKAGDVAAGRKIAENARGYIRLLTQHIDKEDNILYPIADARLTEKQQICLLEGLTRWRKSGSATASTRNSTRCSTP